MSRCPFVAVLVCAAPLFGQGGGTQGLGARAFVPTEPGCEISIDFRSMRAAGVWDGVTVAYASTLLPLIEHQLGIALVEVDRLWAYPQTGPTQAGHGDVGMVLWEGSDKLLTPAGAARTTTEQIGGYEVVVVPGWQEPDPDPAVWVAPKPGVLVYGARHLVEPVLLGEATPGVIPPELLSLVAGRGVLAHVVMTFAAIAKRGFLDLTKDLGGHDPLTVAPDYAMLRLRMDAPIDGDDVPQLHCDGRLRWVDGGTPPAQFAQQLRAGLGSLKRHPRYAALKHLWNRIEVGLDGRDVTLHLGLGRPREAGALFALAGPVLWLLPMSANGAATSAPPIDDPVEAPDEVSVPVPEPEPEPAGHDGQRPGGRG